MSSHQQVSDGLTKAASRDSVAHVLQRGTHRLLFDPSFVATRKVTTEERKKVHEERAKILANEQVFFQDEMWRKRLIFVSCLGVTNQKTQSEKQQV